MNRIKPTLYLTLFLLSICLPSVHAQEVVNLYPDGQILFAKANTEVPKLTIFRPVKPGKQKIGMIVCSGGSYGGRANSVEGTPACEKLAAAGITAFLLDYRVPNADRMDHKELVPLTDAQRAIQYVREHAKQYQLDEHHIGIMGFSAGGHLVSTVVTHFDQTELKNTAGTSLRPDFAVLVYPVISFADSLTHMDSRKNLIGPDYSAERIRYYSSELQVKPNTPPCFIVHAMDDDGVKVANSLYFEAALRQQKVPVEMFLYLHGGHGFGVNNRTATVQWTEPCFDWILKEQWKTIK